MILNANSIGIYLMYILLNFLASFFFFNKLRHYVDLKQHIYKSVSSITAMRKQIINLKKENSNSEYFFVSIHKRLYC